MENPKIRFKKEDGTEYPDWEKRLFCDAFSCLRNNTLSRAELNYKEGNIFNIHYGDVLVKFRNVLDVQNEEIPYVTNADILRNVENAFLQNGDIIIADTAEDDTVGKVIEISNIGDNIVVSGLHTIPCRPIKVFYCGYLGQYMNSEAYHNQLRPLMQGIKVTSVSKSAIQTTCVSIPCLEEQKKIADFLSAVDEVIMQSEAELKNLEVQKKGVIQKIFSQEVRFKREDGSDYPDWKKDKLENMVVFLDEKRKPIESKLRKKGCYPYYGASGIIDYVDDYIFDEELILLSEDGANIIDRNYRVCFLASGKYWVNNHAHCLRPKENFSSKFICEALERLNYEKYNTGSAQPKLNQEVCRKLILSYPCFEEQQKIADFFLVFDEAISSVEQELEKWKELKKGLLQQMFV